MEIIIYKYFARKLLITNTLLLIIEIYSNLLFYINIYKNCIICYKYYYYKFIYNLKFIKKSHRINYIDQAYAFSNSLGHMALDLV